MGQMLAAAWRCNSHAAGLFLATLMFPAIGLHEAGCGAHLVYRAEHIRCEQKAITAPTRCVEIDQTCASQFNVQSPLLWSERRLMRGDVC